MGGICYKDKHVVASPQRYSVMPSQTGLVLGDDGQLSAVNGYKVIQVLGMDVQGIPATYLTTRMESKYIVKAVRRPASADYMETAIQKVFQVKHRAVVQIKDVMTNVPGEAIYLVYPYHEQSTAEHLSIEACRICCKRIVDAILYVKEALGGEAFCCNVKPSNIHNVNQTEVKISDWFMTLFHSADRSPIHDQRGLGNWLYLHAYGYPPKISREGTIVISENPSPGLAEFIKALLLTREVVIHRLHFHPWLRGDDKGRRGAARNASPPGSHKHSDNPASGSGAPILPPPPRPLHMMRNRHYGQKPRLDPLSLARTDEDLRKLIISALLNIAVGVLSTDRFLPVDRLEAITPAATRCLELLHDKDSIDRLAFDSCVDAWGAPVLEQVPLLPLIDQHRRVEGIWWSERGVRTTNEDTVTSITHVSRCFGGKAPPSSLMSMPETEWFGAVFDGHGGCEAAEWARYQLAPTLYASKNFKTNPRQAFIDAFTEVDQRFSIIAEELGLDAGTTATAILIRDQKYWVAHAGDSTAVLCRNGMAVPLTVDHKASTPAERSLVEQRGGVVLDMMGTQRVQGLIQVTRSIGDRPCRRFLIQTPEVNEYTIDPQDEFIILATDGLWDVMTHKEVVQYVAQLRLEIDATMEDRGGRSGTKVCSPLRKDASLGDTTINSARGGKVSTTTSQISTLDSHNSLPPGLLKGTLSTPVGMQLSSPTAHGGQFPDGRKETATPPLSVQSPTEEHVVVADDRSHHGCPSIVASASPSRISLYPVGSAWGRSEGEFDPKFYSGLRYSFAQDRSGSAQSLSSLQSLRRAVSARLRTKPSPGQDILTPVNTFHPHHHAPSEDTATYDSQDERFEDYQVAAKALICEARGRGSNDDITVCIIFFRSQDELDKRGPLLNTLDWDKNESSDAGTPRHC
eukprot:Sspe_Gene.73549::Locus_44496_Transcript_1_1_Confidence_1.000_Length_2955::g.73549::m.73549